MAIKVRVPATTANLGPGYDALGMALTLYADFIFDKAETLSIDGCPEAYRNSDNLVMQGFAKVFELAGETVPSVHLTIRSDIPIARGLGSSSTCVVAGVLAANAWLGNRFTKEDCFQVCTAFEGHPDNVAPALFGGLTASLMNDDKAYCMPFEAAKVWRYAIIIPDYEVLTSEARKVVKQTVPLSAAIHTMSHAVGVLKALETADEELLVASCQDILHEPYRKPLIAEFSDLEKMAYELGANTFFISGSGSTVIAVTKDARQAQAICERVIEAYPTFKAHVLEMDRRGAIVSGAV